MNDYIFDTELVTRMVVRKAAEVDGIGNSGALLSNPDSTAHFPCCVIQPPIQRPKKSGAYVDISVTIEVWADKQYEAMRIFDQIKLKMLDYNLQLTNNTPLFFEEITKKWRFGGYFECRWNAITNSFEMNR